MTQLISCVKCKKQVSAQARQCPSCGENPHGVPCKICNKALPDSESVKEEETFFDEEQDFDESKGWWVTKYIKRKETYYYHQSCKAKVLQVNYSCPACKNVNRQYSNSCAECGHPFQTLSCSYCRLPIIKDLAITGISIFPQDNSYHRECADIIRPSWQKDEAKAKAAAEHARIEEERRRLEAQKKAQEEAIKTEIKRQEEAKKTEIRRQKEEQQREIQEKEKKYIRLWITGTIVLFIGLSLRVCSQNQLNTKPISVETSPSETYLLKTTITGHSAKIMSVAFSRDGQILASGSSDHTIKVWDVATGKMESTRTEHSKEIFFVAFGPDGRSLASGNSNNEIETLNFTTGEKNDTLTGNFRPYMQSTLYIESLPLIKSLAYSPDWKNLASGDISNVIRVWNVNTGKVETTLTGHSSWVNSVAFSPGGISLASGSSDNTIKIWNLTTGEKNNTLTGHSGGVNSVAFSPDGKSLASGSSDNTIKIWDVATKKLKTTLTGHSGGVNSVAFSSDGKSLASGSSDNTIKIWDVATKKLKTTLTGHSGGVNSVAFSPDGKSLASGSSDNTIKIWRV